MEFCFLNKEHICAFANPDLITTNCCNIYISYGEVSHVKIQKKDIDVWNILVIAGVMTLAKLFSNLGEMVSGPAAL
jgi:hypothetical protein